MFVCILGTMVLAYYSALNEELAEPAMQGILYSWSAFTNYEIGIKILTEYAIDQDNKSSFISYHYACLESYMYVDNLLKSSETLTLENNRIILEILKKNELLNSKIKAREIE